MSDSTQPCSDPLRPVRALLSIKPRYAAAILAGEKKYELRRVIFSRRVDTVVIYATAPVRQVVGEFDVLAVISESLQSLWEKTKKYAGVDKDAFFHYFRGQQTGHAIQIGEVRQYPEPFCPIKRFGVKPPQSFLYLTPGCERDSEKPQATGPDRAGAAPVSGDCGTVAMPFSQ